MSTSSTPPGEGKPLDAAIPSDNGKALDTSKTPEDGKALNNSIPPEESKPRDAAYWAQQVSTLKVSHVPTGALNLNVEGKQAVGPLQGFGQMWQKTYRVRLKDAPVQPTEVIKTWKEHFPRFWPAGNRFYGPLTGIAPGEVALINVSMPGGIQLSTGVVVLYADEESFTLMTPQGHVFAGWITFSAHEEDDCTVAQVQVLIRANDPLYELGFRLGASKAEDIFWQRTLIAVAADFEVREAKVETNIVCVDPRLQWSQFWQHLAQCGHPHRTVYDAYACTLDTWSN